MDNRLWYDRLKSVVPFLGTTHGPFSYGAWEYCTGQHKRVKECNYDYSTTEYASHRATTRYEQYSASQHRKYSHCMDCVRHRFGKL